MLPRVFCVAALCVSAALSAPGAQAAAWTYEDRAAFDADFGAAAAIDFEGLTGPDGTAFHGEELVIGDVTFTETTPLYPGGPDGVLYTFDENYASGGVSFYGTGGLTSDYLNQNGRDTGAAPAPVMISFATAIFGFAVELGTLPGAGGAPATLAIELSTGESFTVEAPAVSFAEEALGFFGFGADVGVVSLTIFDPNQRLVIDDLSFSTLEAAPSAAVPVPAAAPLLAAGIGALALLRRRRG